MIVSLALVVILRYVCSACAEPAALRVRRVRLNHRRDVGFKGSGVGPSRVSDRRVVSPVSRIVSLRTSLVGPSMTGALGEHWWQFMFYWGGFGERRWLES